MLVLVTYDVSTLDKSGIKRLNRVAKICVNHGTRVQNSVFECIVDNQKLLELKNKLTKVIDEEKDSLRFYNLGNQFQKKVEHIGAKETINVTEPLIFWSVFKVQNSTNKTSNALDGEKIE